MAERSSEKSIELTLVVLVVLSAFAIDVCIPSIPLAAQALDTEPGHAQLIIGAYLAGYAIGQVPMGLLADRFGRLPVLYGGLATFVISGFATALANDIAMLLAARFVQGIGGTAGPVLARTIARDLTEGRDLSRLISLLVTALVTTTIAAPVVGGGLVYMFGWRASFLSTPVFGLFCIVLAFALIPETLPASGRRHGMSRQFFESCVHFMRTRQALWGTTLVGFIFFGYMAMLSSISSILVDVYEFSAAVTGPVFASVAVIYLAATLLNRRMLVSFSPVKLIAIGTVAFAVSVLLLGSIAWAGAAGFWAFWLALLPFMVGMGFVFPNATAVALAPLPQVAGFAAGILGTAQIAFATMGSAAVAILYRGDVTSLSLVMLVSAASTVLIFWLGRSSVDREANH